MTVGSGIAPDLLTPCPNPSKALTTRALAGSLASAIALPAYRRWGISPRPEDALIAGISGR
jgi:hypothetical protein